MYNHSLSLLNCVMFQVNKSSSDFWNSLKLTWQKCADLPRKCWATSVAELDGKVYVTMLGSKRAYRNPLMYDSDKDQWSSLPALPYAYSNLVTVPDWKQLLAIGGMITNNNGIIEISNKVFLWDEENRKWTTPYPNMPTARYSCSSISHGSTVIVAGGLTSWDPWTMTRAVEVLHIKEPGWFTYSYWSTVEQLPLVVYEAIPLIFDDKLYIAQGYDTYGGPSTCNIVTASLPELLQSSNKNISSGQVWNKLADMPYSSFSINHCQGRLITFGGSHPLEIDENKLIHEVVPLIHIYNPHTKRWDYVADIHHGHLLGKSIHIRENELVFISALTDRYDLNTGDGMMITCSILKY